MIKIASLVPYKIIPPITGGEKGIYYFLKHLSNYCRLTCFTVSENEPLNKLFPTLSVLGTSRNKFRYLNVFLFFKLKKLLREKGITHLIIEHPYYGWLAGLLAKFAGIKIIVHSHNIESLRFRELGKWWWKLLYRYERKTHQLAALNFFISPEDRSYAIEHFFLEPDKCKVITFGTELNQFSSEQKRQAKITLCNQLGIDGATKIILFNGTLSYAPNTNAVRKIATQIAPLFQQKFSQLYKIIICGKGLPPGFNNLQQYELEGILYKGFVEDIYLYFAGADLFINPVTDGGGIKTKLVEALGANTPAVSYRKGAYGVPESITDGNLKIVEDNDTAAFVAQMVYLLSHERTTMPADFYDYFSWNKIAERAAAAIETIS